VWREEGHQEEELEMIINSWRGSSEVFAISAKYFDSHPGYAICQHRDGSYRATAYSSDHPVGRIAYDESLVFGTGVGTDEYGRLCVCEGNTTWDVANDSWKETVALGLAVQGYVRGGMALGEALDAAIEDAVSVA